MKNDPIQEIQVAPTDILTIEHPEDDEDESVGDYHRQAAYHFSAAAKHHLKAADADEDGETDQGRQNGFEEGAQFFIGHASRCRCRRRCGCGRCRGCVGHRGGGGG